MKHGKASPYYGQLMTASLPSEVKKLWYSRNDELEDLPSWQWSFEMEANMEHVEQRDLITKILEQTTLTDREELVIKMLVIEESTLDDIGLILGVTKERVRQIYLKGIRRLRTHQKKVTGMAAYPLDCEVTTWRQRYAD
jgi:RNA polymerase sigma factor (sigma-70 family)